MRQFRDRVTVIRPAMSVVHRGIAGHQKVELFKVSGYGARVDIVQSHPRERNKIHSELPEIAGVSFEPGTEPATNIVVPIQLAWESETGADATHHPRYQLQAIRNGT
jgi:hypothetical protein